MKISSTGLLLIKQFEGLYLKAYRDIAGIWTIGYGTIRYPNGLLVKSGDICTEQQAENWLEFEVLEKSSGLNAVLKAANLKLNQNEYDALCSFVYNLGIGKCYNGTTMGDAIHSKNKTLIADAFLVYCKYRKLGIKLTSKGLLNRRKKERELFLSKEGANE